MAHVIKYAKSLDKTPLYNWAVFSVRKINPALAELESSFANENEARNMFERQYSKWGLTDENLYLANWQTKEVVLDHEVF